MLAFPNCKINLGLRVLRKRPDGYHDIESVFLPIPIHDVLEVISRPSSSPGSIDMQFGEGIQIPGPDENICTKAYRLVQKNIPELPAISAFLFKTIPVGAGLGGGSSDGVAMLKLLNEKFRLNLDEGTLYQLALELGSDCPFFLRNTVAYATGRGEVLEPINLDLTGLYVVLINPGIHINTGWAFKNLQPAPSASVLSAIARPVSEWKNNLTNDFEPGVFDAHPEIAVIKESLYRQKALYASLTGTGSTVYGLFETPPLIDHLFPSHYFTRVIEIVQ